MLDIGEGIVSRFLVKITASGQQTCVNVAIGLSVIYIYIYMTLFRDSPHAAL